MVTRWYPNPHPKNMPARRVYNKFGFTEKGLFFLVMITVIATGSAGLLWAMPGAVACAVIDQTSLVQWDEDKYAESSGVIDHERYEALLSQAHDRIEGTFGKSISNPHIIFFDSARPILFYSPNPYGSTHFIGNKVCIFVGPKGQNVDVVSHELVHADIFSILGTVDRTLHLPVWLDEGLAMQVDYRPQYNLMQVDTQDLVEVGSWVTYDEFFDATEDSDLTKRYALAKSRVKSWVEVVGADAVYLNLKNIVSGGMSKQYQEAGLSKL